MNSSWVVARYMCHTSPPGAPDGLGFAPNKGPGSWRSQFPAEAVGVPDESEPLPSVGAHPPLIAGFFEIALGIGSAVTPFCSSVGPSFGRIPCPIRSRTPPLEAPGQSRR
jgi:hypothetical protein